MSAEKRARGRPKGSGYDDTPTLTAVADLLVANADMKPTAAMKLVKLEWTETILRRLQIKWRVQGGRLLADARARRGPADSSANAALGLVPPAAGINGLRAIWQELDQLQNNSAVQLARKLQWLASAQKVRELQAAPVLRLLRELQVNPVLEMVRNLQANRAMQLAHELQASRMTALARALSVSG